MGRPQQPEINRSGRTPVDPDFVAESDPATAPLDEKGRTGPVPPSNRPRAHPEKDQDRPRALGGAGHGRGKKKDR